LIMDTLVEHPVLSPTDSSGSDNIVQASPAIELRQLGNNSIAMWPAIHYFFALFAVALLCDAASTILVMTQLGPGIELHPVVRMLSYAAGPVAGPLLGAGFKAIGAIIITMYWRQFAAYVLSLASALYFMATCYNIWGMYARVLVT
jgi:hypothetical protein